MMDHVKEGWLLRKHGSKGRVNPFHPLHKSCPIPASDMTGTRVYSVWTIRGSGGISKQLAAAQDLATSWTMATVYFFRAGKQEGEGTWIR